MKWVTEKLRNGMILSYRDWNDDDIDDYNLNEMNKVVYDDFMFGPKCSTDLVPWNYYTSPLPPLKVVLGWTPMKEWISNCKPFVIEPKLPFIEVDVVSRITPEMIYSIHEMNLLQLKMNKIRKDLFSQLGISKIKEGDENL